MNISCFLFFFFSFSFSFFLFLFLSSLPPFLCVLNQNKPRRCFPQSHMAEKTKRNCGQLGWLSLAPTAVLITHSLSLAYLERGGLTYWILHALLLPLCLLFTILLTDPVYMAGGIYLPGNFPALVQAVDSMNMGIALKDHEGMRSKITELGLSDLLLSIHEFCSKHNSTWTSNSYSIFVQQVNKKNNNSNSLTKVWFCFLRYELIEV